MGFFIGCVRMCKNIHAMVYALAMMVYRIYIICNDITLNMITYFLIVFVNVTSFQIVSNIPQNILKIPWKFSKIFVKSSTWSFVPFCSSVFPFCLLPGMFNSHLGSLDPQPGISVRCLWEGAV